jgi:NAD(P)-dependent dehydrogenase (short-subunit alcohol dehydrogenase family)
LTAAGFFVSIFITMSKAKSKLSVEDFEMSTAETGIEINLVHPKHGKTDMTLKVVSAMSKIFQIRLAKINREFMQKTLAVKDNPEKFAEFQYEKNIATAAALVIDWNFEKAFSENAIKDLLRKTPFLAEQIDTAAGEDSNFF